MSREIKFRAWDGLIMYEPMTLNTISHGITKKVQWLQYTGLKDKNGVEIYEEDIVTDGEDNYTVCWNEAGAFFDLAHPDDTFETGDYLLGEASDIEVIGNIYENPELLEAEL